MGSVTHRCEGMPRRIAVAYGDGWHVVFTRARTEWATPITHCPWCGKRLDAGEEEKARRDRGRRGHPVMDVATGERYATKKDAARALGVSDTTIANMGRDGRMVRI